MDDTASVFGLIAGLPLVVTLVLNLLSFALTKDPK